MVPSDFRRTKVVPPELLEPRTLLAQTIVVTSELDTVADDDVVTLREALLSAVNNIAPNNDLVAGDPGLDTIRFNIPGAGPHTILLNGINGPLPGIIDPVQIEGYSQTGARANQQAIGSDAIILIEVVGTAGIDSGLRLQSAGSAVSGLAVRGFVNGIEVAGTTAVGNLIAGNFLGLDASGGALQGNDRGVLVDAPGNTVGGVAPADRNVIANNQTQVLLSSGGGGQVLGNLIGTDPSGSAAISASGSVGVAVASSGNTIGGGQPGAANVISGSETDVSLSGPSASGNLVAGNLIGLDAAGTAAIGSPATAIAGVVVNSPGNTIGGTSPSDGNVIAKGTTIDGVVLGFGGTGNVLAGNLIGADAAGAVALGNLVGVRVEGRGNQIGGQAAGAGNVIVGGDRAGILFDAEVLIGAGGEGNLVLGNTIGLDPSGTFALPNRIGVEVLRPDNTIGGAAAGAGNVISGNDEGVVVIATSGTLIAGNRIGTDRAGTIALGNSLSGIALRSTGPTSIGGSAAGAGNLVSGNAGVGIVLQGSSQAVVSGNRVGTNAAGSAALPNAVIGISIIDESVGNTVGPGNLVSGNGDVGILLSASLGLPSTGNLIFGNRIGTDATGTLAVGNGAEGILVLFSHDNTIGAPDRSDGNLVSGNALDGVRLLSATGNVVLGNRIGSNLSGTASIPNQGDGIRVGDASYGNTIGAGNLVSGNVAGGIRLTDAGTTANLVVGNLVGTDDAGLEALPNLGPGVRIQAGAAANSIGGGPSGRNVISGNGSLLETSQVLDLPAEAVAVAAVDLGGEPTADLAVLSAVGGGARLTFFMDGGSSSTPVETLTLPLPAGSTPVALIASTSPNGARLYVAANGPTGGTVTIVRGTFGNLTTEVLGPAVVGDRLVDLAVLDLDGDTFEDLIIASAPGPDPITQPGRVRVLFGGAAGFSPPVDALSGIDPTALAGAAFAFTDPVTGLPARGFAVVSSSGNDLRLVLIGTGRAFQAPRRFAADTTPSLPLVGPADVVFDGSRSEFLVTNGGSNTVSGLRVFSFGAFVSPTIRVGPAPGALTLADLNDDGTNDLIVANRGDGTISLVLSDPGFGRRRPVAVRVGGTPIGLVGSPAFAPGGQTLAVLDADADRVSVFRLAPAGVDGLLIEQADGNVVAGNYIGVGADGQRTLGNRGAGIRVVRSSGTTIGGPLSDDVNVIAANEGDGIALIGGSPQSPGDASGTLIQGNRIGTDASGTRFSDDDGARLGNLVGVRLDANADANSIVGNVISGSFGAGLLLDGFSAGAPFETPDGNLIRGNRIGTDINGFFSIGNADGISLLLGRDNTIGGTDPADANIISGNNESGIRVEDDFFQPGFATGNLIQGNRIGVSADGFSLGNFRGVYLVHASRNTIGGTGPGEANDISSNGFNGVTIFGDGATGNSILGNRISANSGLGIDLGDDGVTPNDDFDADLGPNAFQNAPEVTEAVFIDADTVQLSGLLQSTPGANFLVEFYADRRSRFGGLPQGEIFVGRTTLSTDPTTGIATFSLLSFDLAEALPGDVLFTALATETENGNTSEFSAAFDPYLVTNTDDAGTGSLRRSMENSNATAGVFNEIQFAIPGAGPGYSIAPASALPPIADPASINASTQPGYVDRPVVELNGVAVLGDGLEILAGSSFIRGLAINRFGGDGIAIRGPGGNRVVGNFIGIDLTGTIALGNAVQGVTIDDSPFNVVGEFDTSDIGTSYRSRNLISGNGSSSGFGAGIQISGTSSLGNRVGRNVIGPDVNGAVALGNGSHGVIVNGGARGTTIGGTTPDFANLISGNGPSNAGIAVGDPGTDGTVIVGNRIGTDQDGTAALPNAIGIIVGDGASGTSIGGPGPGEGNLISGNVDSNILLDSTSGVLVRGNTIGTDAAGAAALDPAQTTTAGIFVDNGTTAATIGGTAPGEGNLISGAAGVGLLLQGRSVGSGPLSGGILVQGNLVGTDRTGTLAVGNGDGGIRIDASSTNTIGGLAPGSGNTVAFNDGAGVGVRSGTGNAILGNSIFANAGIAIDLGEDGITPNDLTPPDADLGANDLQNAPVLSRADAAPTSTILAGSLVSTPNTTFTVQFFAGPSGGPTASGDAQTLLGQASVTTDNTGNAPISAVVAALPVGQRLISATATDPSGNTSEVGPAVLPTGLVVVNTDDTGPGSLRQAILDSNDQDGLQSIIFAIPGSGTQTIAPGSPLPDITDAVFIDATTQPGYDPSTAVPVVELAGLSAGASTDGLRFLVGGNGVQGLAINRFGGNGLAFVGGAGNLVARNRIGTDPAGTVALGNLASGILLQGSDDATIGGTDPNAGNLLSGNQLYGLHVLNSSGTLVIGNRVGTDAAGTAALGNRFNGIHVESSASNTIGGTDPAARNLLSGNGDLAAEGRNGLQILGVGSSANLVLGNFIGVDATGTLPLGNLRSGVVVNVGAVNNTIGGTAPGAGNVLSANTESGVYLQNAASSGNVVLGNRIGTDAAGTIALGNALAGVVIQDSPANTIGGDVPGSGNQIVGGSGSGVLVFGAGASGNQIVGNRIGTDAAGTAALGVGFAGVFLFGGSTATTVGGTTAEARNVLSGGNQAGVLIDGSDANLIRGNFLGTDASGTLALGNRDDGVTVFRSLGNTIGGLAPGEGNVLSGNLGDGIDLEIGSSSTLVVGNRIGTDADGTAALGNGLIGIRVIESPDSTIGGSASGAGNLISGNGQAGIEIFGVGTTGTLVQGNRIGTDADGSVALGNGDFGVLIRAGASGATVGGTDPAARNLISGSDTAGVMILDAGTTGHLVAGNFIGTDAAGVAALPNAVGVTIQDTAANTVGGTAAGAGNLLSGNLLFGAAIAGLGASGNVLAGNLIGTDASGTGPLGNQGSGVAVGDDATANRVGLPGAGNVIAASGLKGVLIIGVGTSANLVQGNRIGVGADGLTPLGNLEDGVQLSLGATDNTVGGAGAGAGNVVAASGGSGVRIVDAGTSRNVVAGNFIGTDASGTVALGNLVAGVGIEGGSDNTIGGPNAPGGLTLGNVISGNGTFGVIVTSPGATGNRILGNRIGTDASGSSAIGNAGGGVRIEGGTANVVGGTDPTTRNVLSGNGGPGLAIVGPGTSANLVLGNLVGTDATGTVALGNAGDGVLILNSAANTVGAGGVLSGNTGFGLRISGATATANLAIGNLIGTDVSGGAALPNLEGGVAVQAGASANSIGAAGAGNGNVISGNGSVFGPPQVLKGPISPPTAFASLIADNLIGDFNTDLVAADASGFVHVYENLGTGTFTLARSINLGGLSPTLLAGVGRGVVYVATGEPFDPVTVLRRDGLGGISITTLPLAFGPIVGLAAGDIDGDGLEDLIVAEGPSSLSGDGSLVVHFQESQGNFGPRITLTSGSPPTAVAFASLGFDLTTFDERTAVATTLEGSNELLLFRYAGNRTFAAPEVYATGDNPVALAVGDLTEDGRAEIAVANAGDGRVTTLIQSAAGTFSAGPSRVVGPGLSSIVIADFDGNNRADIATSNSSTGTINLIRRLPNGALRQAEPIRVGVGPTALVTAFFDFSDFSTPEGLAVLDPAGGSILVLQERSPAPAGVLLEGAPGNLVAGNRIGLASDGRTALGNLGSGVVVRDSAGATIGGATAAEGNVIGSNEGSGVEVAGTASVGTLIRNNLIGTDAAGTAARGNLQSGVRVVGAVSGTTVADNLLSGNFGHGLFLDGQYDDDFTQIFVADGTLIRGNRVGTDATGTRRLANTIDGLHLQWARNTTVGGTAPGAGNLLSGNQDHGIALLGESFFGGNASGTLIQGNTIGLDLAGTAVLGNGEEGIFLDDAQRNTIGGPTPEAGNVIAGNGDDGIAVRGPTPTPSGPSPSLASRNLIQGNLIGTNRALAAGLGNGQDPNLLAAGIFLANAPDNTVSGNVIGNNIGRGMLVSRAGTTGNLIVGNEIAGNTLAGIRVHNNASLNTIGGIGGGANVIRGNGGSGIELAVGDAEGNPSLPPPFGIAILGNAISGNGGLGIDLGADGVTPDDPLDADPGLNAFQNTPSITSVRYGGDPARPTSIIASGSIASAPNTTYRVELFLTPGEPSGPPEGRTFLGAVLVMTDAQGVATFTATVPFPTGEPGTILTATATDPVGNTSEFSAGFELPTDLRIAKDAPGVVFFEQGLTYTITVSNAGFLAASGVVVTDLLPAGLIVSGASTSKGSVVSASGGSIVVSIGDLAPGESATVTIVGVAGMTGTLVNTATVSASRPDADPGNDTATAATVVPEADLALTKSAPAEALFGSTISYTMTVRNVGPGLATSVVLTDALPAGFRFSAASSSQGTVGLDAQGRVVAALGSLAPQGEATVTIVGVVDQVDTLVNTATVSTATTDSNPANNTATASTSVAGGDLAVLKEAPAEALLNGELTFTITVRNAGLTVARGVVVSDPLPAGFLFLSATSNRGTAAVSSGTVIASIGDLGPGESATVTIVGVTTEVGAIVNTATASSASPDPFPANDSSTTTTLVVSPSSFVVVNTNDSGPGSLRAAILNANTVPGLQSIIYAIPSAGTPTIRPTSALPALLGPVFIDGTTQPGGLVELDGAFAGSFVSALVLFAGGSTVSGHVINRFGGSGIVLLGASNSLLLGNRVGTDVAGTLNFGNGGDGIVVSNASGVSISGNLISGNAGDGVKLTSPGSSGNLIIGNRIGTDSAGQQLLGNSGSGILIANGASANTVGGAEPGTGNLLSGNRTAGVLVLGAVPGLSAAQTGGTAASASRNLIVGNQIGVAASGPTVLANGLAGVLVSESADNTIGGPTPAIGNVLAGGFGDAVLLVGGGATRNLVAGNAVGTPFGAPFAYAGTGDGIVIEFGASANTVGGDAPGLGNLIAPNVGAGVLIGTGASFNQVIGNRIGNSGQAEGDGVGVLVQNGASANVLRGNRIGGNAFGLVLNPATSGNLVVGNVIGLSTPDATTGNEVAGLIIRDAADNTVGGPGPLDANLISGNGLGLLIEGISAVDNRVLGNIIGLDGDASQPVPNGTDGILIDGGRGNIIGGLGQGDRNVLSGNGQVGVHLRGLLTSGNLVIGNQIGTRSGETTAGNGLVGVYVEASPANVIAGNVVSGNGVVDIQLSGVTASGNLVAGNLVGTGPQGEASVNGAGTGIFLEGASGNTIGGLDPSRSNLVSGHSAAGIHLVGDGASGNLIIGNRIGTDLDGSSAIGNQQGITIDGAPANTVGGLQPGAGNLISGNRLGVVIANAGASGNVLLGNLIGTDAEGVRPLPNADGGVFLIDAPGNSIGGAAPGAGNVVSGNGGVGIQVFNAGSSGNVIAGNRVGVDRLADRPIPNADGGIYINNAPANTVGGAEPGAGNVVSANRGSGVVVSGIDAVDTVVTGNIIGTPTEGASPEVFGNEVGLFITGGATTTRLGATPGQANTVRGNRTANVLDFGGNSGPIVIGIDFVPDATGAAGAVRVTFSDDLDPRRAQNARNYRLNLGETGLGGSIPVTAATYDPESRSVLLRLGRTFSASGSFRLTVVSRPPGGVASTRNRPLDGNADGVAGDNFVATYRNGQLVRPPASSRPGSRVSAAAVDTLFGRGGLRVARRRP